MRDLAETEPTPHGANELRLMKELVMKVWLVCRTKPWLVKGYQETNNSEKSLKRHKVKHHWEYSEAKERSCPTELCMLAMHIQGKDYVKASLREPEGAHSLGLKHLGLSHPLHLGFLLGA